MKAKKSWVWRLALSEANRQKKRLFSFSIAIIMGIAAYVAINSFDQNIRADVDDEAKELLGADIVFRANKNFSDSVRKIIDSVPSKDITRQQAFVSMGYFPKTEGSRLVQVRAIKGNFPYYGSIETDPQSAAKSFRDKKAVLVDKTVMLQFKLEPGDSIRLGQEYFKVEGALVQAPGQAAIFASAAPVIYMPLRYLSQTGLATEGSRIIYRNFLSLKNPQKAEQIRKKLFDDFETAGIDIETIKVRKKRLGRAFSYLTDFLGLVGFVSLFLGAIGVAGAVFLFVKEKTGSVAILKCLGASSADCTKVYLIQIVIIGLLGTLSGIIAGVIIQYFLPNVFKDFLPFDLDFKLSWISIAKGFLLGMAVTLLFGLLPLVSLRKIPPIQTIRNLEVRTISLKDNLQKFIVFLIAIMTLLFLYLSTGSVTQTLIFSGGLLVVFLLLSGLSWLLINGIKRYFPTGWSFVWRQGLSNLFRPNNQTLILIVTIGLGTMLIATLYFIQNVLVSQIEVADKDNQPNLVMFDIQPKQLDKITEFTEENDMPIIQNVPIVTMRIQKIKGRSRAEIKADSLSEVPDHILDREYRVTYRDSLTDTEEIVKGEWVPEWNYKPGEPIPVSLSENVAGDMNVGIGDKLTYNVQGTQMEFVIKSLRKITWNQVQTNFSLVFPKGVFEQAPHTNVIMTRAESKKQSAEFQQQIVKNFPNVSVVDLELILKTLDTLISKVSFAIQFMAFFSIATGILVLIVSISLTRFQRIKENVLLKTLGASRGKMVRITAIEFFLLAAFAAFVGILLAIAGSSLLASYNFSSIFIPDWKIISIIFILLVIMVVSIGLLMNRKIFRYSPLQVLRAE